MFPECFLVFPAGSEDLDEEDFDEEDLSDGEGNQSMGSMDSESDLGQSDEDEEEEVCVTNNISPIGWQTLRIYCACDQ
jgi:hypothetical protein